MKVPEGVAGALAQDVGILDAMLREYFHEWLLSGWKNLQRPIRPRDPRPATIHSVVLTGCAVDTCLPAEVRNLSVSVPSSTACICAFANPPALKLERLIATDLPAEEVVACKTDPADATLVSKLASPASLTTACL